MPEVNSMHALMVCTADCLYRDLIQIEILYSITINDEVRKSCRYNSASSQTALALHRTDSNDNNVNKKEKWTFIKRIERYSHAQRGHIESP